MPAVEIKYPWKKQDPEVFAFADALRSHEAPGRSGAKLSFSWYSAMIEVENNTALQKRDTVDYQ